MRKDSLAPYRARRDFDLTDEPSGKTLSVPKSKQLRFVIQRHDATRLHYDLRLELDGTFKSWAVTKGPSLDPKVKRLAVEADLAQMGQHQPGALAAGDQRDMTDLVRKQAAK